MAADGLGPYIARSLTAMVLYDKQVLFFSQFGFQLLVPSQCWEIKKMKTYFMNSAH